MEPGIVVGPSRGGMEDRVDQVSTSTGWPAVERRGALGALLAQHGVGLAYVAARDGDRVTDGRTTLRVERGLLHAKRAAGTSHPLMRAIGPAKRVLDGTLGLAGDALHLATRYQVVGAEVSPVVACLVEDGLARLGVPEAERVQLQRGSARRVFEAHGPFDAVFLAPMFTKPAAAAPGYDVFRRLADHRPLDIEWWSRCPVPVVVRVEKGTAAPWPGMHALPGKAVDYWITRPTGG